MPTQHPMVSDLYKASTQRKAEIDELMNEIEMPDEDESLTVSSMSQSPFQVRSNPAGSQNMQQNY